MPIWLGWLILAQVWFAVGCEGRVIEKAASEAGAVDSAGLDGSAGDAGGLEASFKDANGRDDGSHRPIDGGRPADAEARMDGGGKDATPREASVWEAGTCVDNSYWVLEPRTITNVSLLDGAASRMGATDRLLVDIQLESGCELFGKLEDLGYSGNATDFMDLAASAWTPKGLNCAQGPVVISRVYSIAAGAQGNLRVVVTDHNSPGGGMRMDYNREVCATGSDCPCGQTAQTGAAQEGESCNTDCSCAAGLSCLWVPLSGLPGGTPTCQIPCIDSLDCPEGRRCSYTSLLGAGSYTCSNGDQCQSAADCTPGFDCVLGDAWNQCVDRRGKFPDWPGSAPCSCDAECRPGHRCIDPSDGGAPGCAVICSRSVECPPGDMINAGFCDGRICVLGP